MKAMHLFRKIAYNCRKATFLIEKQQIDRITLREQLELKIHLAGCPVCRTFRQQSILINQMLHHHLQAVIGLERKLDDPFKQQLQKRIEERL